MSTTLHTALVRLETWFNEIPSSVVAFSGGVDSAVVVYLAKYFLGKPNTLAVTACSPSLKATDLQSAERFCMEHEISWRKVQTHEIKDKRYQTNPANRCYFCKHTLYTNLRSLAVKRKAILLNGQNVEDFKDYRPGIQAGREHGVRSPLAECNIEKKWVRQIAKHFGLVCWDKPASPCLSSRIPYGQAVTVQKLRQVEQAEALLLAHEFRNVRVRHDASCARLEVDRDQIPALEKLIPRLEKPLWQLGFKKVEIDYEGFASGKLNRALERKK